MQKLLVSLLLLLLGIGAHAQINDPNAEIRAAKDYHGISVSSAFDVYLNQSNEEAVAVSASETKFRDRIKVEVRDGILHIWYDNEGKWNMGNKKLKAYISFKQIDQFTAGGACQVYISGVLKANDLTINLSGATDMKGKLDVQKLDVNISGASDMIVSGIGGKFTIDASGASDFKGFDFVTDYCNATATGASDIRITVNKEISAHASGASDVKYKGDGVVKDMKTSGASSISKSGS